MDGNHTPEQHKPLPYKPKPEQKTQAGTQKAHKPEQKTPLPGEANIQKFLADLARFREMTRKFYLKELSVPEYKHISGGFGSYAQRGGTASMLRLRLTGGEITKEMLNFIAESIDKYEIDLIHLTTCQSLQFHDLKEDQVAKLVEEAFDHGSITRGGGGDYPRNVMASPLSGVRKGEPFDVLPYAKAAADYLLGFIDTVTLPRKLKVCFSNSPENQVHATFRDLGFIACSDRTFDVYSAGGLGRNPRMGVKVASHIPPEKTLYYIKAMIDTFLAHGNYENRGRARTRFMQEDLGVDGYLQAYQENLQKAFETESLDLAISESQNAQIRNTHTQSTPAENTQVQSAPAEADHPFSHPRVIAQKQPGLYAVFYKPAGGNIPVPLLRTLSDAFEYMEGAAIRITPNQSMYIINCTEEEAKLILNLTNDSVKTRFEMSVACIGAAICQVGARDSQALLSACLKKVQKENFADGVLPLIRISGCPSSCSAHQAGALSFRGGVRQTPEGPKPAFAVFAGGCDTLGEESFGEDLGVMLEEEIPSFLVELGRAIASDRSTYEEWVTKNPEKFKEIYKKYI